MTLTRSALAMVALAAGCLFTTIGSVEARYRHDGAPPDYVVAESRYGKGVVSGPVRPVRYGYQVRLPGGTWVDCGRSCSETLRRQSVDFWESNGPQARDSGPGYFRWHYRY